MPEYQIDRRPRPRTVQPDIPVNLAKELRSRVRLEVPGRAYPVREYDNACLEGDAKHRRVVFVRDILDEIHELGAEHLLDAGGGRLVVDVLKGSTFDGAAGLCQ